MEGHEEIIDKIQQVRARNNKCWMDILRLAFHHAPNDAKRIFQDITDNDNEINELSKELGRKI